MFERLLFSKIAAGGIERQESEGRKAFVNSTTLPKKSGDWARLERWGVIRAGDADDLFVHVTLPKGWQKQPTDHSMWNKLVDDQGLLRAMIFYKAASYDRDAFVNVVTIRYRSSRDYDRKDGLYFEVKDAATDTIVFPSTGGQYGVLKSDPSVVGFILGDRFYYQATGSYGEERFSMEAEETEAMAISCDEFYTNFHNKSVNNYPTIGAAEKLAARQASERANELNTQADW